MNELDKIFEKLLSEMTEIETAIWYTAGGTTAYDMEKAAADLARLQRIEQAYIKAAMYAEELQESQDDKEEYWGQRFYKALDAAALKQSS